MKIRVMSDLHISWHKDRGKSFIDSYKNDLADVLVIAGDINNGHKKTAESLKRFCGNYKSVVYVLGNHEYYNHNKNETLDFFNNLDSKVSNLYWLENKRVKIGGHGFVGGTLWFERSWLAEKLEEGWSDFRYISNLKNHVYDDHLWTKCFFLNNTQSGDIIISHHSPSYKSLDARFLGLSTNVYFHNNMDSVIIKTKPKYYIHGHTHINLDYRLGKTRVICNPLGYAFESTGYKDLVIDI